MVATLLVAPIAVRYGAVATITATQLLSVPCMLAFGFAPGLLLASATFLARGALMEMTVPVRDSFLMEVVPERVRATANAILTLSGQALAVLTIPVGARLLDAGRYPLACALAAAMYVVSAAALLALLPRQAGSGAPAPPGVGGGAPRLACRL